MDLNIYDALVTAQEEGIEISIEDPNTREPIGMKVKVAGPDSQRVKTAQRAFLDRQLAKKRSNKMKATELEEEATLTLAAAVISWSSDDGGKNADTIPLDGQRLPCTKANVLTVIRRFPFIREQIDAVVQDRADFFQTPSTPPA